MSDVKEISKYLRAFNLEHREGNVSEEEKSEKGKLVERIMSLSLFLPLWCVQLILCTDLMSFCTTFRINFLFKKQK